MICPYCKEMIQDLAIKCRYCGSFINSNAATYTVNADSITPDEIRVFIGTNSCYYLQQFPKFNRMGVEKFAATWNWSCFGFTWLWMLYRKMYAAAAVTFVIFWIPGVNILLHILAGIVGNWLYFTHMKNKVLEIRAVQPSLEVSSVLQEEGGVHRWVITAGLVISICLAILFAVFFATILTSIEKFSGVVI